MNERLHVPLLLPTLAFIVGCVAAQHFGLNIWIPLAITMVAGVLFVFKSWSALLLVVALGVGGVRGTMSDSGGRYSWSVESRINQRAQESISKLSLSSRAERLVKAMLLGDRDEITQHQRRKYGYSGASHILAVSGMHLSIIFVVINLVLLPLVLLPRGHIIRNFAAIALMWGYACIVGLSPSVVRSVIMFSVLQLAWASGRAYSGANALLFTLLVAVAISPAILYSVAFQLSVVAVAAIYLWALPLYYRVFGGGNMLVSALCIGVACSVATLPIVSHSFGYIALLGAPLSPLYIITASVIIICGTVWIFLPFPLIAPILHFLIESAAMIQERVVEWIAGIEWSHIAWRASELQLWIIYLIYALLTLLVWSRENR